jgi:transcription initiation factor IIE alpha subunit
MNLEADYSLFDCAKCSHREVFEVAAEYNFLCPVCGGSMTSANDPNMQKELTGRIKKIELEMVLLNKMK